MNAFTTVVVITLCLMVALGFCTSLLWTPDQPLSTFTMHMVRPVLAMSVIYGLIIAGYALGSLIRWINSP